MCDMCGEDGQKGRLRCIGIAKRMQELSRMYYDLAEGRRKPHTKDMEMIAIMARAVIRDLVEDHV